MDVVADSHWVFREISCPVCGSGEGRHLGYRGGAAHRSGAGVRSRIVRCGACDLRYPRPMPFPRDGSHYEDAEVYFQDHSGEAKINAYVRVLTHAADLSGAQTGRMLDIGAGCGESLAAAQRIGWEGCRVEPSVDFVSVGFKRYGVKITPGLVEDAGFAAGSFDVVLLAGVLEHVFEPMTLLRQAHRLLRPGGLLYIDVPNEASAFNLAARFCLRLRGRDWTVALSPTFPPYHVVGFSPKSLDFALGREKLRITERRNYALDFDMPGVSLPARQPARGLEEIARRLAVSSGRGLGHA